MLGLSVVHVVSARMGWERRLQWYHRSRSSLEQVSCPSPQWFVWPAVSRSQHSPASYEAKEYPWRSKVLFNPMILFKNTMFVFGQWTRAEKHLLTTNEANRRTTHWNRYLSDGRMLSHFLKGGDCTLDWRQVFIEPRFPHQPLLGALLKPIDNQRITSRSHLHCASVQSFFQILHIHIMFSPIVQFNEGLVGIPFAYLFKVWGFDTGQTHRLGDAIIPFSESSENVTFKVSDGAIHVNKDHKFVGASAIPCFRSCFHFFASSISHLTLFLEENPPQLCQGRGSRDGKAFRVCLGNVTRVCVLDCLFSSQRRGGSEGKDHIFCCHQLKIRVHPSKRYVEVFLVTMDEGDKRSFGREKCGILSIFYWLSFKRGRMGSIQERIKRKSGHRSASCQSTERPLSSSLPPSRNLSHGLGTRALRPRILSSHRWWWIPLPS